MNTRKFIQIFDVGQDGILLADCWSGGEVCESGLIGGPLWLRDYVLSL